MFGGYYRCWFCAAVLFTQQRDVGSAAVSVDGLRFVFFPSFSVLPFLLLSCFLCIVGWNEFCGLAVLLCATQVGVTAGLSEGLSLITHLDVYKRQI